MTQEHTVHENDKYGLLFKKIELQNRLRRKKFQRERTAGKSQKFLFISLPSDERERRKIERSKKKKKGERERKEENTQERAKELSRERNT